MYTIVGALAAVENVFPPVPADTAVALGAFLSRRGTILATAVFAVTWIANVGAATAVYVAARTWGRSFFTGRLGRRLLKPRRLARIERLYDEYGTWGIFLSRFLPGVRAVVPPFAGIVRLSAPRALLPMALASGLWYGALTFTVAQLADEIEDVARLLLRLNWVALALVLIVLSAVLGGMVMRRRRSARDGRPVGGEAQ